LENFLQKGEDGDKKIGDASIDAIPKDNEKNI
jgi:hypothetical protein